LSKLVSGAGPYLFSATGAQTQAYQDRGKDEPGITVNSAGLLTVGASVDSTRPFGVHVFVDDQAATTPRIVVTNGGGGTVGTYTNFYAAISACPAGGTLTADPAIYGVNGNYITNANITIKSSVPGTKFTCINSGSQYGSGFTVAGDNFTLIDCYLIGFRLPVGLGGSVPSQMCGIYDQHYFQQTAYSITCTNCKFEGWPLAIETSAGANCNLTMTNCEVYNCGDNGTYTENVSADHGIYHGGYGRGYFTATGCWFHNDGWAQDRTTDQHRFPMFPTTGHFIKSNAIKTIVKACRLGNQYSQCSDLVGCESGGEIIIQGCLLYASGYSDNVARVMRSGRGADPSDITMPLYAFTFEQNTLMYPDQTLDVGGFAYSKGLLSVDTINTPTLSIRGNILPNTLPRGVFYQGTTTEVAGGALTDLAANNTFVARNKFSDMYDQMTWGTPVVAGTANYASLQYVHPAQSKARSGTERGGLGT